jgi:hypothetical protein
VATGGGGAREIRRITGKWIGFRAALDLIRFLEEKEIRGAKFGI